jgi:cobalt-precorrin 5A hydrolase/precorrin-3B C17-methyltransferase
MADEAQQPMSEPAIVILGGGSLYTARRIQANFPHAKIHGLKDRVGDVDVAYAEFGPHLRELFLSNIPIVVMCATGIVVRALAPLLANKRAEPPVVVVAENGSAVVPLLGGLSGVNAMAYAIAEALEVIAAITTTGEVRFGVSFEVPPAGYIFKNQPAGKKFMSDLLAGAKVRIDGDAPWLRDSKLPRGPDATHSVVVTPKAVAVGDNQLVYHPRSICVGVNGEDDGLSDRIVRALDGLGLARESLSGLFAPEDDLANMALRDAATKLNVPVRFVPAVSARAAAACAAGADAALQDVGALCIGVASAPIDADSIGRGYGRLAVVGLGPGDAGWLSPEAKAELARATDLVGYETYLNMAGPLQDGQRRHSSDNREEEKRSRFALDLAAEGKSVVVVSSGDPGIFAMATAVLETLHRANEPRWHTIEVKIVPGISAAQGAAAHIGAPLGHDFCVISLSDVLKPWETVEARLDHAAAADLVIAMYNPTSRFRPWQLERARDVLLRHRKPETPVIMAKSVGRGAEEIRVVTLATLDLAWVDMRTIVIVGSSKTERFPRLGGGEWVYTPRHYERN